MQASFIAGKEQEDIRGWVGHPKKIPLKWIWVNEWPINDFFQETWVEVEWKRGFLPLI